jgi:predicted ATPase
LGATLRHRLRIVAQCVEFGANRCRGGQLGIGVAFLRDQLPAHFSGTQARIQAGRAELRVGLALAIDNRLDIGQEGRQMVLGPFPPTQRKGIDALDATVQFAHAFADGHAAPAQFARGALLGLIIEAASGESYEAYIERHIFAPLDMRHSYTTRAEAFQNGLAVGHRYWFAAPIAVPDLLLPRGFLPAGYLISSAEDMAHYLIAQLNEGHYRDVQVLSPAGIADLHRPAVAANFMGAPIGQYAMGWYNEQYGQTRIVWHTGIVPDFFAYMALLPEQKKGVMLLINADHFIVKVLVTSREVLRLYGEHEVVVPPLTVPDPAGPPALDRLSQYDAVQLFIQRAQSVRADFTITNENAPAVAEICTRLDGLPLAIELAAVRTKLFAPEALLARLSRRLQLLTRGARTLSMRQQTLRNTIAWSNHLLTTPEQRLFARLAVFVGGATLEAVAAVCNADGDLGMEALDGLASLVDKSLLRQVEIDDGASRFRMLETIREYALEQLAACGEAAARRRAHASYYLALAEAAMAQWDTPTVDAAIAQLKREHDNLRAALQWARGGGDPTIGLQLAGALWRFWRIRGYLGEGRVWLEELLALSDPATDATALAARLRALHGAAWLASDQHDFVHAAQLFEQRMALRRALGETESETSLLDNAALQARAAGQYQRYCEESLALLQKLGVQWAIGFALNNLALAAYLEGDLTNALGLVNESVALFRAQKADGSLAEVLITLGQIVRAQRDGAAAYTVLTEALQFAWAVGPRLMVASALEGLASVVVAQGTRRTGCPAARCSVGAARANGYPGTASRSSRRGADASDCPINARRRRLRSRVGGGASAAARTDPQHHLPRGSLRCAT